MTIVSALTVGVLHPGQMGASLGAVLRPKVADVLWAEEGRSDETAKRAEWADLVAVRTLTDLVSRSNVIVSVCPPDAAVEVARAVAAAGGVDLYIDANAVAPSTMEEIDVLLGTDHVVDGAIIGPPVWKPATTVLHLSGQHAEDAASLFSDTRLETRVVGPRAGQASAVKACFALQSKALPTIWAVIGAAAQQYGVGAAVREELARDDIDLDAELDRLATRATTKAWRWVGEMTQSADAMATAHLPDGISLSAAEVYRRVAAVLPRDEEATADDWLMAMLATQED